MHNRVLMVIDLVLQIYRYVLRLDVVLFSHISLHKHNVVKHKNVRGSQTAICSSDPGKFTVTVMHASVILKTVMQLTSTTNWRPAIINHCNVLPWVKKILMAATTVRFMSEQQFVGSDNLQPRRHGHCSAEYNSYYLHVCQSSCLSFRLGRYSESY